MFGSINRLDDDFLPPSKKKKLPSEEDHKIAECLKNVNHRFTMHVSTDKHQYKPGETVHIRGILLNEFHHRPAFKRFGGETFNFRILGPSGSVVLGGDDVATPGHQKSVVAVDWKVPEGQSGGTYKVVLGKQYYEDEELKKDEEASKKEEEEIEDSGEDDDSFVFAPGTASNVLVEDNRITKIGRNGWNSLIKYPINNKEMQKFGVRVEHSNHDRSGIRIGIVGGKMKKGEIWKSVSFADFNRPLKPGSLYEMEVSESTNSIKFFEDGNIITEANHHQKLANLQRPLSFGVFLHYKNNQVTVIRDQKGGFFPISTREFDILNYTPPKFKMNLKFERKGYTSGELAKAELKVERSEGGAPNKCDIVATARVDGVEVFRKSYICTTGVQKIEFLLPKNIQAGDGKLNCSVTEGVTENTSKTIPILLKKLDCRIFPEGGDLVYDCCCGCYVEAFTLYGDPADFSGFLMEVDEKDGKMIKPVVQVRTVHEGRGSFEFTPKKGKKYYIKVLQPFGISVPIELPPIKDIGLSIRLGVKSSVAFGNPIDVIVSASRPVETKIGLFKKEKEVSITPTISLSVGEEKLVKLDPKDVDGVLRMTAFFANTGFGVTGFEYPISERLVMVRPRGTLDFEIESKKLVYSPGEKCEVVIRPRYLGKPVPAIVCCTVTDDSVIQMLEKRKRPPRLIEMVYLENEVKELKDCSAYVTKEVDNDVAPEICCDLLLGSQGWRRFVYKFVEKEKKFYEMEKFKGTEKEFFFRMLNLPNPEYYERKEIMKKKLEEQRKRATIDGGGFRFGASKKKKKKGGGGFLKNLSSLAFGVKKSVIVDEAEEMGDMLVMDEIMDDSRSPRVRSKKRDKSKKKSGAISAVAIPRGGRVKREMEKKKKKPPQKQLAIKRKMKEEVAKKKKKKKRSYSSEEESEDDDEDEEDMEWMSSDSDSCSSSTDCETSDSDEPPPPMITLKVIEFAREFAHQTRKGKKPEERDDFTETVFFSPYRETEFNKKSKSYETQIQFDLSDSISSFIVRVDAFSKDGAVGSSNSFQLKVQKPFFLAPKLPLEVSMADEVLIPLGIVNNLPLKSKCKVEWDAKGTQMILQKTEWSGTIGANERKVEYFNMKVDSAYVEQEKQVLTVKGQLPDFRMEDVVKKEIGVKPYGFLCCQPFSGTLELNQEKTFEFVISGDTYVPFSLETAGFVVPSSLGNLKTATQSLIREPYGCFEQVSSTMYPMILAKQFLMNQGLPMDTKIERFLKKGYDKLMGYEIKTGGFDWYGSPPANESLSAMGLVQFIELCKCFTIDPNVIDRTRKWLLGRRDGTTFKKGRGRYAYGHAKEFTTNAYIIWSLSRAGGEYNDVEKIMTHLHQNAIKMKDSKNDNYVTSLLSLAYYNFEKYDEALELVRLLIESQHEDGSFKNCLDTMTRSGGRNKYLECTALSTLAMMNFSEEAKLQNNIAKSMDFIVKNNRCGSYGSTQSTVLCLQAVIKYFGSSADDDGKVDLEVNGIRCPSIPIPRNASSQIDFEDFKTLVKTNGEKNKVVIRSGYGKVLPFSMAMWYKVKVPPKEQENLPFTFETRIRDQKMKEGDSTEVVVKLENKLGEEEMPMIVAIVAIPSGCTVRMEKLKELKKMEKFAYFELFGARNVVFYWRGMQPKEKVEFAFDVSATIPGKYVGDASRAYLYYDNDVKFYVKGLEVEIDTK